MQTIIAIMAPVVKAGPPTIGSALMSQRSPVQPSSHVHMNRPLYIEQVPCPLHCSIEQSTMGTQTSPVSTGMNLGLHLQRE